MIRGPTPRDQGYIAATWSRSMLSTHVWQRHGSARTGAQIGKLIDTTMDRPDTSALIRCDADDPTMILGWVVFAKGPSVPTVHYLYTRDKHPRDKRELRDKGIARELLRRLGVRRDMGVVCTSLGPMSEAMRGRYPASVYVPLEEFLRP